MWNRTPACTKMITLNYRSPHLLCQNTLLMIAIPVHWLDSGIKVPPSILPLHMMFGIHFYHIKSWPLSTYNPLRHRHPVARYPPIQSQTKQDWPVWHLSSHFPLPIKLIPSYIHQMQAFHASPQDPLFTAELPHTSGSITISARSYQSPWPMVFPILQQLCPQPPQRYSLSPFPHSPVIPLGDDEATPTRTCPHWDMSLLWVGLSLNLLGS